MIKLENVVLASPEQMEFIIEGMRNPMNSWDKSDSVGMLYGETECYERCVFKGLDRCNTKCLKTSMFGAILGENDHSLMQRLAIAGTDHRKFMRMMPVYVRITAPLYWWKEFDTYKVGTVANSCSTMHKIQEKEFTLEDFSTEHLQDCECVSEDEFYEFPCGRRYTPMDSLVDTIKMLNKWRDLYINGVHRGGCLKIRQDKDIWWQMIQLLPSSYNQTRNVMMNYEVLANIYKSRRCHKLDEWVDFCEWIETLPYSELIMSAVGMNDNSINARQGVSRHIAGKEN